LIFNFILKFISKVTISFVATCSDVIGRIIGVSNAAMVYTNSGDSMM
jgi:hypothetical protein